MAFKKAKTVKGKPDKKGKIIIRVFRQAENNQEFFPTPGNLREDFAVEDSTVSEVAAVINQALFEE